MSLDLHFPGNQRVRQQLERALASGRLAGSYLFEGAPGAGQEQAAIEVAAAVITGDTSLDNPDANRVRRYAHPDLHYMLPVVKKVAPPGEDQDVGETDVMAPFMEQQAKKGEDPYYLPSFSKKPNIPIEALRQTLKILFRRPFEGLGKVMIIRDADLIQVNAQDVLLKTLEEPPPGRVIILISYRPGSLRPTILSRCQRIPFNPLPMELISGILQERGAVMERAVFLATLANGDLEEAIKLAAAEVEDGENSLLRRREEWLDILDACELGSDLDLLDAVQGLTKGGKKGAGPVTQERADFLALAISWYRELLLIRLEGTPPRVHIDQECRLGGYRDIDEGGLLDRISRCEKARGQILSNASAQLTLLSLFFSFRPAGSARRGR